MSINFISSKDSDETHNLRAKSNNTEIISGNKTNKIIDELFESLLQNYQKDLEESMIGSNFILIVLIYFACKKHV